MTIEKLALNGTHNIFNSMAAAMAARVFEVSDDMIRKSLIDFENIDKESFKEQYEKKFGVPTDLLNNNDNNFFITSELRKNLEEVKEFDIEFPNLIEKIFNALIEDSGIIG